MASLPGCGARNFCLKMVAGMTFVVLSDSDILVFDRYLRPNHFKDWAIFQNEGSTQIFVLDFQYVGLSSGKVTKLG